MKRFVLILALLVGASAALRVAPALGESSSQTSGAPTPTVPCAGIPNMCPVEVTYYIGWSIVAGTAGNLPGGLQQTVIGGTDGPLYTFQAGDAAYEVIAASTPLQPGWGYWAHFSRAATELLPQRRDSQPVTLALPAGQLVMIGNPFPTPALVTGAD